MGAIQNDPISYGLSYRLRVIASGDVDSMKKVKGIGAKTASRIIIDLQDKVGVDTGSTGTLSKISSPHNTIKKKRYLL